MPASVPVPVSAPVPVPVSAPVPVPASRPVAETRTAVGDAATGTLVRTSVVRVSPETMPYLLDHCFFPQR